MLTGKELGAAIGSAISKKGVKPADVARHFGVKPPSVNGWVATGRIGKDKLSGLFDYFSDVAGPEHWGMITSPALPAPSPAAPGPDFIPVERVLLKVSAGVTGYQVEHLQGNGPPIFFRADWIAAKGYRADKLIALRVTGDSMEPNLWDGDLVVLNSADTQPRDGEVFVANYEGEVVIKRLERNAGEWWLTSDNARHKPKRCDEHAELIGRVVYKQSERI